MTSTIENQWKPNAHSFKRSIKFVRFYPGQPKIANTWFERTSTGPRNIESVMKKFYAEFYSHKTVNLDERLYSTNANIEHSEEKQITWKYLQSKVSKLFKGGVGSTQLKWFHWINSPNIYLEMSAISIISTWIQKQWETCILLYLISITLTIKPSKNILRKENYRSTVLLNKNAEIFKKILVNP